MHYVAWIFLLTVLAEFRSEVHGDPTVIGCYIRGFDGLEDGRCTGVEL